MRFILFLFFTLFFSQTLFAQKKLKNFISNADKRKVEHAKKLLNQGEIFEGEKILLKLRKDNMNHAYFHEALIQVQKQILHKIQHEKPPSGDEGEYFLDSKNLLLPKISLAQNFVDNGLARTAAEKKETIDNIRLGRADRKALKKLIEHKVLAEDTTLNPIEAAKRVLQKESLLEKNEVAEEKELTAKRWKEAENENELSLLSYESYAAQLVSNARLATLKHERVDSSSHYLRMFLIDTINYDSLVAPADLDLYHEALDFYYTKEYIPASKRLKVLTYKYEEHFNMQWHLANCYLQLGLDSLSYKQFVYISQVFTERPEGLLGLSRYYLAKGKYKDAAACIVKAITIYPEDSYFAQLDIILKRMGTGLKSQWVRREVYPISTARNYEEIMAKEDSPWRYYQAAKSNVYSYASKGVIRPNEITNERYLEVYAWKEMLAGNLKIDSLKMDPKEMAAFLKKSNLNKKKNKDKDASSFPFARAMEKMGYLDCYVFISMFHHDIYDGFKDFVLLNPDKIEKYFFILLNWDDKRFDKFRVGEEKTEEQSTEKNK